MDTRELVLDTLLTLEREGNYSNRLVKSVLDKYDYLEAREKAFLKRLTEGVVERQLELDYYLDFYSSLPVRKMKPLIRCLLRMSVYQLLYMDAVPDSAVCNEACKLAARRKFGNLKGFVNGILRRISREKDSLPLPSEKEAPVKYFSVRYSMPEWLVELWLDEYGSEITATLLEGLMEIHPVSLRFSSDMAETEREGFCENLRQMGMQISPGVYLPYICLAEGFPESPAALSVFAEGKCMVQDVSSALAVEAAGIKPGDFVVDVCAAPGGKSILAAEKAAGGSVPAGERTNESSIFAAEAAAEGSIPEGERAEESSFFTAGKTTKGSVLARDISAEKADRIRENIDRMGMENIEVQVYDGTCEDETLTGKADVVLLDVPCSGLGVMGKKRDIKYRVKRENLAALETLQRQIVSASAGYVKPGGTLLYSTCTIRREENQDMVRFLTEELGFVPVPLAGILPETLIEQKRYLDRKMREAGKDPMMGLTEAEHDACIQLLPGVMEADGFFIACFRRACGE